MKALLATWGDPPYELKRRKGATQLAKGPRHTPVIALPTLARSLEMTLVVVSVWRLLQSMNFTYHRKYFFGRKLQASGQLTSLRGLVCQFRFQMDLPSHLAIVRKSCSGFFHFMDFGTFGSSILYSVVLRFLRSVCSLARRTL